MTSSSLVERRDRDDRAEDLFAIDAATDRQAGDHRRRKEITATAAIVRRRGRGTAERDLAALLSRELDVELYLLELRLRNNRALVGRCFERIAHPELRRSFDKSPNEFVISRSLDEDTRATEADLALIGEGRAHAAGDGRVQVGVGENDVRVFSAQVRATLS